MKRMSNILWGTCLVSHETALVFNDHTAHCNADSFRSVVCCCFFGFLTIFHASKAVCVPANSLFGSVSHFAGVVQPRALRPRPLHIVGSGCTVFPSFFCLCFAQMMDCCSILGCTGREHCIKCFCSAPEITTCKHKLFNAHT